MTNRQFFTTAVVLFTILVVLVMHKRTTDNLVVVARALNGAIEAVETPERPIATPPQHTYGCDACRSVTRTGIKLWFDLKCRACFSAGRPVEERMIYLGDDNLCADPEPARPAATDDPLMFGITIDMKNAQEGGSNECWRDEKGVCWNSGHVHGISIPDTGKASLNEAEPELIPPEGKMPQSKLEILIDGEIAFSSNYPAEHTPIDTQRDFAKATGYLMTGALRSGRVPIVCNSLTRVGESEIAALRAAKDMPNG